MSPIFAEPDRGNLLVTVRPLSFLTFTGGHQNFLVPQYPSSNNVRSSVDQGSAGLSVFATSLNAAVYRSTYENSSNHAISLSVARNFTPRLQVMANYLASRPRDSAAQNSFISTFTEVLTSRLSVNEVVTTAGGNTGRDLRRAASDELYDRQRRLPNFLCAG